MNTVKETLPVSWLNKALLSSYILLPRWVFDLNVNV